MDAWVFRSKSPSCIMAERTGDEEGGEAKTKQNKENIFLRVKLKQNDQTMETETASAWTSASFSRCEPMEVAVERYDGRRLRSVNCLPLSTTERLNNQWEWERGTRERGVVRQRVPEDMMSEESNGRKTLPSSSSSEVMDLERMDRAVVGARFGGGGAEGHRRTKQTS